MQKVIQLDFWSQIKNLTSIVLSGIPLQPKTSDSATLDDTANSCQTPTNHCTNLCISEL